MSEMIYWLWLAAETEVSKKSMANLLAFFEDAETAFRAPIGSYREIDGISKKDAERLEKRDIGKAVKMLEQCIRSGITVIPLSDENYPNRLRNVYSPPPVLFVKGSLPKLDSVPVVSVVGTRTASDYGIKMARSIGYELGLSGITVASGLTKGIDAAGAEGAFAANGSCIGVLGTAIDAENGELSKRCEQFGAVISEIGPGTVQNRSFFRNRNRITAGISIASVAVEAPEKSGTLLLVREALEQGKDIYAVPGNADSKNSVGIISMLRDGAVPVLSGLEVASQYVDRYPHSIRIPENVKIPESLIYPDKAGNVPVRGKQKDCQCPTKPADILNIRESFPGLREEQYRILEAIQAEGSFVDEIVSATCLTAQKVLSALTVLEIKGIIRRTPGKKIIITPKARNQNG